MSTLRERISKKPFDFSLIAAVLLIVLGASFAAAYFPDLTAIGLVLATGGLTAIFIAVRWPELFLILALWTNFLKSAYLPGLSFGEFGATPYLLFTTAAIAGFAIQILTGKRRLIIPTGILPFLIFAGFTTLSLLIVQDFRAAIGSYIRTVLDWAMLFLLSQMLVNRRSLRRLMNAILIQAFVVVSWGIAAGIRVELLNVQRRALFFWDQFQKNDFAAYLGVVLVVSLATYLVTRKRWKRMSALLLLLLVPVGWMFTFSRGGFLAIITCLLVFILLERKKKLLKRMFQIATLVGLFSVIVITFSPSETRDLAVEGLLSLVGSENVAERHGDTIEFRVLVAQSALEVFTENPLLGVGFNQWQFYSPHSRLVFDPQAGELRETGSSIHNRYLLIATNSGIVTLLGYLLFLATILITAMHYRKSAEKELRVYFNAFIAAVLGSQIALLFAPTMLWEWPLFGILAGLINLAEIERSGDIAKWRRLKFRL